MTRTRHNAPEPAAMSPPRFSIDQLWGLPRRPDPAWEEAKRRLWAMSPDERRTTMYARRLSLRLCLHCAQPCAPRSPAARRRMVVYRHRHPEHADDRDGAAAAADDRP